jgi:DNA polymerase elongation subunit (family B)
MPEFDRSKPVKWTNKTPLEFQAVEWIECDEVNRSENSDPSESFYDTLHNKKYVIFCFGVNAEGHSVCMKINNYNPYFYMRIPPEWSPRMIAEFNEKFLNNLVDCTEPAQHGDEPKWYPKTSDEKINTTYWKSSLMAKNTETTEKEIFWSFMNHKKYNFWKLYFQSKAGMKFYHQYLKEQHKYPVKLEYIKPTKPKSSGKPKHPAHSISDDIEAGYDADDAEDGDDTETHINKKVAESAESGSDEETPASNSKLTLTKFKLFESDLEPLLRFFHDAKIQPSGWLTIPAKKYEITQTVSTCNINIEVDWQHVKFNERVGIPPLITASFDIECDSSHGDFPIARKDTKKLANELVICWLNDVRINQKSGDSAFKLATKDIYFRDRIKQALRSGAMVDSGISPIRLKSIDGLNAKLNSKAFEILCKAIYEICNRPIRKVKANRDMKSAMSVVQARFEKLDESKLRTSKCHVSINEFILLIKKTADERGLEYIELRDKMMTKELLVQFVNYELKRFLPAVIGDPIIQIGTVFWRYGDSKPFYNNILTLAPKGQGCGNVDGASVESFESELKMLVRWSELIRSMDPDIVVGYNTFGFDEAYMYDRIVELCPFNKDTNSYPQAYEDFLNMGRFTKNIYKRIKECRGGLLDKKLSSSALGDNYFYYFNMAGRVQIDLLKVAQASMTKLPSYKLDNVAEYYIGGKVEHIGYSADEPLVGNNWIKISNIRDVSIGQHIKILEALEAVDAGSLDSRIITCEIMEVRIAERLIRLSASIGYGKPVSGVIAETGVKLLDIGTTTHWLKVANIKELEVGNYIVITMNETNEQLYDGKKLKIEAINVDKSLICLADPIPYKIYKESPKWGIGKDDISPQDIFRLQKGTNDDRALIAKYCIQDCALVIRLLRKLETISNNFGMSNVCLIPFCYIFMRGQGIKIFSLICNECAQENFVLPVLDKITVDDEDAREVSPNSTLKYKPIGAVAGKVGAGADSDSEDDAEAVGGAGGFDYSANFNEILMTDEGYEGAIVLDPKPDFYKHPISILDFGSLYPSEMIASNLSHDSLCEHPYWLGDDGAERIRALGYDFIDRTFDNYTWVDPDKHSLGKRKCGITTARFIQFPEGKKGLIPRVLQKLLKARKAMKKLMESSEPARAVIYEGLQLAYKLTANSLYGQIGAKTSKIYKSAIAASTTAGGRARIIHAKNYVLEHFKGSEIVYGDTDSIFVKFDLRNAEGVMPTGQEAIKRAIDIGVEAEHAIQPHLPAPHVLEYEKVFYPLMLITKKRYAGDKYEFDPTKCKFTSMGIVLKRRDNAPILKYIYGGVIKILMKEMNVEKAVEFVRSSCRDMLDGKFDVGMFVISKTLRDYYKDPESIAHKVLADRMAERDAGNKPACNERIPYAYIQIDEKNFGEAGTKVLQGDRIEHVSYIQEKGLKLDYVSYIESQLIAPISQIFELVVEQIKGFPYHRGYFRELEDALRAKDRYKDAPEKVADKISEKKQDIVYKLIFHEFLMEAKNSKNGLSAINKWFKADTEASSKPSEPEAPAPEPAPTEGSKVQLKQKSIAGWIGGNADEPVVASATSKKAKAKPKQLVTKSQNKITAFFGGGD